MTREEQVAQCVNCELRSFDPKKGVLCSLTNAYGEFEGYCENFKGDDAAISRNKKHDARKEKKQLLKDTLGLSAFGVKRVSTAGWIVIGFGGLLTMFFLLFGRLSIWGFGLIIYGAFTVRKGKSQKIEFKNEDILDSDF